MSEVSKRKREAHAPLNSQYCSIKIGVIEDPVYRKEKSTTNSSINMSPPPLMELLLIPTHEIDGRRSNENVD